MNLSGALSSHLIPVFFVYGLAFFSFGLAASLQDTEGSTFELRNSIWSLAAFGFLHGASEWADMFAALGDSYWSHWGARLISHAGLYLGIGSFLCLLDFGVSAITSRTLGAASVRIYSRSLSLVFLLAITGYGLTSRFSNNWLVNSDVVMRYLLAFPASALAAIGFVLQSKFLQTGRQIRRSMAGMAICFAVYSFLAGWIVRPAGFFPASVLNYVTFIHAAGIPVQLFRAACAICAAYFVHGMLSMFTLESKEKLRAAVEAADEARADLEVRVFERTRELGTTNEKLKGEIAERTRLEAEARKAQATADEANRAKSEFLANMSHEIRTPLNGVIGMVELSLDTKLTADQRDYLQSAKSSADSLLTVINDILDFSRIEARRLQLDPVKFSLRDIVGDAVGTLALRAEKKNLELACHFSDDTPDEVIGDGGRLRQIVLNLVGNAIKFTNKGEVIVNIEKEWISGEQIVLHFSVRDTGIGIASDKKNTIFEAFRQADNSTTRMYGGTGLGLAISSQLVGLMEGHLWVESDLGRGSTFHFTATFGIPKEPAVRPAIRTLLNLAELPVLVVDDNATNRRILHDMLAHWHMKPVTKETGDEALVSLEQARSDGSPYPLVIVDRNMPGMDGFDVVEHIRRNPEFAEATIMMLSSSGKQEDIQRCRELGIAAYLTKPVQQSALLNAIVTALEGPLTSAVIQIPIEPVDWNRSRRLRVLVADDNPINQKLALRILEKRECIVEPATNGKAVLEALEKSSFDVLLMDVQMPEMDGFEATAIIRESEKSTGRHLPIIAVTAHAMKGDRERCLAAGMDGYLAKPIDAKQLFKEIDRLVPDPEIAKEITETEGVIDEKSLRERVDNDDQLLKELVSLFQEDGPKLLFRLRDAIAARNPSAIEMAAHALKGTLATFAAQRASDAALRLEIMGREEQLEETSAAYESLESEVSRLQSALEAMVRESHRNLAR